MEQNDKTEFDCPRAVESPFKFGKARWRDDGTCSYCGSLSEDRFFEAIAAGAVIGPTDKSYKVYLRGDGFTQTYRNCPRDSDCKGPDTCTHWVTRPISQVKFYFQHLSDEGQHKFIDLYNKKEPKLGYPGRFYVTSFFCSGAA